jgi:outer membrane protein OmpA-like peptidoglycan-associated protein
MAIKSSTKGALILFLILALALLSWFFVKPMFEQKWMRSSSDASSFSEEIRIGGDNYIGYWFVNSPEMRKNAARKGINILYTDDGAMYEERLRKFNENEYDCIVLPVNSYLQHGAKWNYPGVITAAISESKGADGIIGYNLNTVNITALNDPSLKFIYTVDSPSKFLLDLVIHDFDLDRLKTTDDWRIEVNNNDDVFKAAKGNKGDIFITWEPDMSKILEMNDMQLVFGSDNFRGYIIDVFVFNRKFLKNKREAALTFFRTYFNVLGLYANNKELMLKEMNKSTNLKEEKLELLLKKIDWFDIPENCAQMFGITLGASGYANDGIVNCIISCTDVMLDAKVLNSDPLKGDPYLIINSSILEDISKTSTLTKNAAANTSEQYIFEALSENQWKNLQTIGTFKVRDITFQSWNNDLTPEGEKTVDKSALMLINNYPSYRIIVRGHTAPGGDEEINRQKSYERAQIVAQRLIAVYNIDQNRIRIEGAGSAMPPAKLANETFRAYQYRKNRVEFIALKDNPI